jgi:SecD/SecF fusion protein
VNNLVNILRSGALPETLKPQPVSESTIGATLGEDTIRAGVTAIILAFLAVLAFMIVYYRFAGLVASVALLANLVLTIGFMVAVKATFTLPGLAGLVLMLGMAVDANILIYERLREERERGASLPLALRNGYERAFGTIIDTHLSSIFTAIVLYIVGNDALKGFGVTLTVGLIISLFTSLYMTRVLFDLWQSRGWLKKLTMLRLFARPDIDFMGIRYYWFTATIILTLLGVSLFLGRGTAGLNIDFVGGTAYAGELKKPIAINELRQLFDEDRQKELLQVEVKEGKDPKRDGYELSFPLIKDPMRRTRTVYLANLPEGDTPKEREANLKQRVSRLPEWSLEQIFLSGEQDPEAAAGDKSRYFNIRTLEKEPEIVQAVLDQLLQEKKGDSWEPLLKRVYMTYDLPSLQQGNFTRLRFYDSEGMSADKQPHDASPSFIKTLLMRELEREFGKPPSDWTFTLDLAGEGKGKDGRFAVMKLSFIPSGTSASKLEKAELDSVRKALDKAVAEFERRPQPMRLETFDSALAAETRLRAMAAILLSWGAILLYLWFRFGNWTFGLAAVLCLIHDLCFTLGVIAACHYIHTWWPGNPLGIEDFKIDLTAVAALLTLVGYSVNDTIVVFDRIREVRGKNPDLTPNMINDSVNQTLSRTVLASLTTWLVVVVLYIWGGPGVHLFAFVMVVGVIVGTYSSIYIASPLLLLFGEGSRAVARGRERAPTETPPDTRIQPAT